MSIITDTLTKAGYEIHSTGDDILPAAITKDNGPVGFLMPDLSVSLVEDKAHFRDSIQNALDFAIENQGLPQMDNEYILTQYGKTILTAEYDYDEQQQNYNIYSISDNGRTVIDSYTDKGKATQMFAGLSGLVGDGKTVKENDRTQTYFDKLINLGYKISNAIEESNRAYEITDGSNNVVGYINHNNKLTLTTDVPRHRKTLTDTYLNTNSHTVALPSFFERLKNLLKEIGLALKVTFTSHGERYAINDKNKEIAVIDQNHNVAYNPLATTEQMDRINRLVDEIKQEMNIGVKLEPEQTVKEAPIEKHEAKIEKNLTTEDINSIIEALLENPQVIATLNPQLTQKLAVNLPQQEAPVRARKELTKEQRVIGKEFNDLSETLKTLEGFNPDKYSEISTKMLGKFSTLDPHVFSEKLRNGDYGKGTSLSDKLKSSKDKATEQNSSRTAQPIAKEPQEKEVQK